MSEPGPDATTDDEPEFSPAEAFALLGDETRVAILEALATDRAEGGVPFADLRERVGIADSGRFNYHLKKLVGRFVEKGEDGYRLTFAGMRVVGAVYEGTYARSAGFEPLELDDDCPLCGGPIVLDYADERIRMNCTDCGEFRTEFGFPPGALAGRDREALPRALTRHIYTLLERHVAGFCGNCTGPVEPALEEADEEVVVHFECGRCGEHMSASLRSVLLTVPAVIAFSYDHGVDVHEELAWNVPWMNESGATAVSGDPPRYETSLTLDDETLRVVVDEDLRVVEAERFPAER